MPTKKRRIAAADPSLVEGKSQAELKDLYEKLHKDYENTRLEIARLKVIHGIDVLEKNRRDLDVSLVLVQDTLGLPGADLRKELCLGKTNKELAGRIARKKIKQTVPSSAGEEALEDPDEGEMIDEAGYELEYEDEDEDLYEVEDVLFVDGDDE